MSEEIQMFTSTSIDAKLKLFIWMDIDLHCNETFPKNIFVNSVLSWITESINKKVL